MLKYVNCRTKNIFCTSGTFVKYWLLVCYISVAANPYVWLNRPGEDLPSAVSWPGLEKLGFSPKEHCQLWRFLAFLLLLNRKIVQLSIAVMVDDFQWLLAGSWMRDFTRVIRDRLVLCLAVLWQLFLKIFGLPLFVPAIYRYWQETVNYWAYMVIQYFSGHFGHLVSLSLFFYQYFAPTISLRRKYLLIKDLISFVWSGSIQFLLGASVFRLEDLKVPSHLELGYPGSWGNPQVLYQAMYQQDGFFFWTLKRDFDSHLFRAIQEHYALPYYLQNMPLEPKSPILAQLRQLRANGQLEELSNTCYTKLVGSVDDSYQLFFESLRYTLLEELQRDPLFILRICLGDCSHPSGDNVFTNYIYETELLDDVFQKWSGLDPLAPDFEPIASTVEVQFDSQHLFVSDAASWSEKLLRFLRNHGFIQGELATFRALTNELFFESFLLVLPYELFWGKALFLHGMFLPFWALWSKPIGLTAPWILLPVYGLTSIVYYSRAISPVSLDEHYMFEDTYWHIRIACSSYLGLDPEKEEDTDTLFCVFIWLLIPLFFDWLKSPYFVVYHLAPRRRKKPWDWGFSHVVPQYPDYKRFLVRRNRGRYQGAQDYFLWRFFDEYSPIILLQTFWTDQAYRQRVLFKTVRTKLRNDRNFFLGPAQSILDLDWLVTHLELSTKNFQTTEPLKFVSEILAQWATNLQEMSALSDESTEEIVDDTGTEDPGLSQPQQDTSEVSRTLANQGNVGISNGETDEEDVDLLEHQLLEIMDPLPKVGLKNANKFFTTSPAFYCGRGRRDPLTGEYVDRELVPFYAALRTRDQRLGTPLLLRHFKKQKWEQHQPYWRMLVEDGDILGVHRFAYDLDLTLRPYCLQWRNRAGLRFAVIDTPPPKLHFQRMLTDYEWNYIYTQFDENLRFDRLFTAAVPVVSFQQRPLHLLSNSDLRYYGMEDSEQDLLAQYFTPLELEELLVHASIATGASLNVFLGRTRQALQKRALLDSLILLNDFFDPISQSPNLVDRPVASEGASLMYEDQAREIYLPVPLAARHHPKDFLVARKWVQSAASQDPHVQKLRPFDLNTWLFSFFELATTSRDSGLISYVEYDFLSANFVRPELPLYNGRPRPVATNTEHLVAVLQQRFGRVHTLPYRPASNAFVPNTQLSALHFSLAHSYFNCIDEEGFGLSVLVQNPRFVRLVLAKYPDLGIVGAYNLERPLLELVTWMNYRNFELARYFRGSYLFSSTPEVIFDNVEQLFDVVEIELTPSTDVGVKVFRRALTTWRNYLLTQQYYNDYDRLCLAAQQNQLETFLPFCYSDEDYSLAEYFYFQAKIVSCWRNKLYKGPLSGVLPHPTQLGTWLPFSFAFPDEDVAYYSRLDELRIAYSHKISQYLEFNNYRVVELALEHDGVFGVFGVEVVKLPEIPETLEGVQTTPSVALESILAELAPFLSPNEEEELLRRQSVVQDVFEHVSGQKQVQPFLSAFVSYNQSATGEQVQVALSDSRLYPTVAATFWSILERVRMERVDCSARSLNWTLPLFTEPGDPSVYVRPIVVTPHDFASFGPITKLQTILEETEELRQKARVKESLAPLLERRTVKLINELVNLLLLAPEESVELQTVLGLNELFDGPEDPMEPPLVHKWKIHANLKAFEDAEGDDEREIIEVVQGSLEDLDPCVDELRRHVDSLDISEKSEYRRAVAILNEIGEEGHDYSDFISQFAFEQRLFTKKLSDDLYYRLLSINPTFEMFEWQWLEEELTGTTEDLLLVVVERANQQLLWELSPYSTLTNRPPEVENVLADGGSHLVVASWQRQVSKENASSYSVGMPRATGEVLPLAATDQIEELIDYINSFAPLTTKSIPEKLLTPVQWEILREFAFKNDEFDQIYKMFPVCMNELAIQKYRETLPAARWSKSNRLKKMFWKHPKFSWDNLPFYHDRALLMLYEDLYVPSREYLYDLESEALENDDVEIDENPDLLLRDRRLSDEDVMWQVTGVRDVWRLREPTFNALKEQLLLVGVYEANQLMANDRLFLLQLSSLYTSSDLYGAYTERSFGTSPLDWFDVYDLGQQTLVEAAPQLNWPFKEKLILDQNGYQRSGAPVPFNQTAFALVDQVETLTTGFTQLEQTAGVEFAVVYYTQTYFGMTPSQFFETFLYGSYWTTSWLQALYHVINIDPGVPSVLTSRAAPEVRGDSEPLVLEKPEISGAFPTIACSVPELTPTYSFLDRMPYISERLRQVIAEYFVWQPHWQPQPFPVTLERCGLSYLLSYIERTFPTFDVPGWWRASGDFHIVEESPNQFADSFLALEQFATRQMFFRALNGRHIALGLSSTGDGVYWQNTVTEDYDTVQLVDRSGRPVKIGASGLEEPLTFSSFRYDIDDQKEYTPPRNIFHTMWLEDFDVFQDAQSRLILVTENQEPVWLRKNGERFLLELLETGELRPRYFGPWETLQPLADELVFREEWRELPLYVFADGRRITPEGTRVLLDESQITSYGEYVAPGLQSNGDWLMQDGTVWLPNGIKVLQDGTQVYPDNSRVFRDGRFVGFENRMLDVDGSARLPGSAVPLADGSYYMGDGSTLLPTGQVVNRPVDTVIPALLNHLALPAIRVFVTPEVDLATLSMDLRVLRSRIGPAYPIILWAYPSDVLRGVLNADGQVIMPLLFSSDERIQSPYHTLMVDRVQHRLFGLALDNTNIIWFVRDTGFLHNRRPVGLNDAVGDPATFLARWHQLRRQLGEPFMRIERRPQQTIVPEIIITPVVLPDHARVVSKLATLERVGTFDGTELVGLGGPFWTNPQAVWEHKTNPLVVFNAHDIPEYILGTNPRRPTPIPREANNISVDGRTWSIAELEEFAQMRRNRFRHAVERPLILGQGPRTRQFATVTPVEDLHPIYLDTHGCRLPIGDPDDFVPVFMDGVVPRVVDPEHPELGDTRHGRPVIMLDERQRPYVITGLEPAVIGVPWHRGYIVLKNRLVDIQTLVDPIYRNYYFYSHPFVCQHWRTSRVGFGIAAPQGAFRPAS